MGYLPEADFSVRQVAVTGTSTITQPTVVLTPTAAIVWNLPATVDSGGNPLVEKGQVITIRVLAAYVVTVKTTDSTEINNVAGATGIALPTGNTTYGVGANFQFDGTAWWSI